MKGQITGRHVLIMVLGFFAVTITVNAVFITQAFRTFRGEDVPRSYMQGVAYNETLAAREAQAVLGWTAAADARLDGVDLVITDRAGEPVTGLMLAGRLRHPADANRDIVLSLVETEAGRYAAAYVAPPGSWRLVVETDGEGPPFTINRPLWLR
ncbi:FixH family protein [Hyphobacterium marinum]|uniref:FixH family protein n=1 Tax=Hyphobacterium marinum TaxID=3116574 RepID=A0ABU7LU51_9PROT|nr:FixH family protein [Hyphobacterium sp. Y6023]MEE2565073.1 FixH family protein [Hyphobacterium sp. Y6023]